MLGRFTYFTPWYVVLLLFISLLSTAQASMSIIESPEELAQSSDRICAIKIIRQSTELRGQIVLTRSRVEPLECWKNKTSKPFDILWPGGSYQSKSMNKALATSAPGAPQLKANDAAILYLKKSKGKETFVIHNWTQGSVPLTWDSQSKQFLLLENWAPKVRATAQTIAEERQHLVDRSLKSYGSYLTSLLKKKKK